MLTIQETRDFLRIDTEEEDALLATLILTAKELTEEVLRRPLTEFNPLPHTIRQAMLIVVSTLYEERQITKDKGGLDINETLDLVKKMLFAYRREKF